jgi:hypothetical protein
MFKFFVLSMYPLATVRKIIPIKMFNFRIASRMCKSFIVLRERGHPLLSGYISPCKMGGLSKRGTTVQVKFDSKWINLVLKIAPTLISTTRQYKLHKLKFHFIRPISIKLSSLNHFKHLICTLKRVFITRWSNIMNVVYI